MARNIHIVKPDDGNIFRNACAAFAQTCHNCGGILVAADTDAGKILPRGELTSQRNASFSIEGVKIVDEKIRSWRDARFAQRVAVAHITLIVVHEAAVNRADEQNIPMSEGEQVLRGEITALAVSART